jgi:hypothetical protein
LKVSPFSQNWAVRGSAFMSVFGNQARQTAYPLDLGLSS